MESMDELISQAADFISSLLPFLNNINIVGLILSFVSLVLSVLLCFWAIACLPALQPASAL